MGLFSWIKKHPWESALLGTAAVTGGAGLAGMGPLAGLLGGEAVAAPSLAGATEYGLGGAGEALFGSGAASALAGATEYGLGGAGESLVNALPAMQYGLPATEYGLGGAGEMMATQPTTGLTPKMAQGFNPQKAMMLASLFGGGGQPQQMGTPARMGNPMQRPALVSQEDIMKRWLMRNDPNTYMRLYGQPQGGA